MLLSYFARSKSASFIFLLCAFAVGITAASVLNVKRAALDQLSIIFVFSIIAVFVFWPRKEWRLLFLGVAFLFFGLLRFAVSEPPLDREHLRFYHGRLAEIKGTVTEVPEKKNGKQTAVLAGRELKIMNWAGPDLAGQLVVKGRAAVYLPLYPQYNYGDKLSVRCVLAAPEKKEDFNYPAYLAKERIWSICLNAQAKKIGEGGGFWLKKKLLDLQSRFNSQINRLLPEPPASFLAGLLYGARSTLSEDLKNSFNRTGLTHIVAVSGYNITIIATALLAIFKGLGLRRQRAFGAIILGIVFFVIFTGAGASVVRAGIMGVVALWARQAGRTSQAGRILLLTAVLMFLINPRLLFDAGFKLSFAATFGLIYVSPLLEKYLKNLPAFGGIKEAFLTTLAALLATWPLIIFEFGRFSLIAPLANLLILPMIPLTMALGFAALGLSFIFLPLGQIAAWIVWLPLTYIIKIAEFLGGISWAAF